MGKNNKHKKFLKSEKAKVKLKPSKKLTKGQNITDTSFKVKKIVIQSQLTQQTDPQPVTKKQLSLKDLASRCNHHNTNMRVEALNGLLELATNHGETLVQNLCTFVSKTASLCIDREAAVRKESLKLLSLILTSVSPEQLEPFLSELLSYLTVGLSHLYRDIQEDALLMLDAILHSAPSLVASAAPKLLPAFLDQISVRKNNLMPERSLSLNLQSTSTSTRWRIKVLGRLHALLVASSELQPKSVIGGTKQGLHFFNHEELCLPITPYKWDSTCVVPGLFNAGAGVEQDLFSSPEHMKKYVEVLMPLLFETWVEVGPSQKQQKAAGNLISAEATELLECILEIMELVYNNLKEFCQDESLIKWFRGSFRDSFVKHILAHFPYLQKEGFQPNKISRSKGQVSFEEEKVKRCNSQNLAVCLMACIFCDKPTFDQAQLITEHVIKCLDGNQNISDRLVSVLEIILIERCDYWVSIGLRIEPLANSTVSACLRQKPDMSASPLFDLLCDLSVKSVIRNRTTNSQGVDLIYEKFIQELPQLLAKETVPSKVMQTITTLIGASHPGILISLRTHLTFIIGNLSKVYAVGMSQQETRMRVLYFLFSASVWRADILDAVGRQLKNSSENNDLLQYFIELLDHWRRDHPDTNVAVKLNLMPWLMT